MSLIALLKKIRNRYVKWEVGKISVPDFEMSDICRKKIIFEGRVQRVGFRYEVRLLASKLGLTGYARNLDNRDVETELQGEKDKIYFLIETLRGIPRIVITNCTVKSIPVKDDDTTFTIKP